MQILRRTKKRFFFSCKIVKKISGSKCTGLYSLSAFLCVCCVSGFIFIFFSISLYHPSLDWGLYGDLVVVLLLLCWCLFIFQWNIEILSLIMIMPFVLFRLQHETKLNKRKHQNSPSFFLTQKKIIIIVIRFSHGKHKWKLSVAAGGRLNHHFLAISFIFRKQNSNWGKNQRRNEIKTNNMAEWLWI